MNTLMLNKHTVTNDSIDALNRAIDHFLNIDDIDSYKKVKHILLLLDTRRYGMAEVELETASSVIKEFLTTESIVGEAAAKCFSSLNEDNCRKCKKCGNGVKYQL